MLLWHGLGGSMAKLWKDVLWPGEHHLHDGRVARFSRSDCESAFRNLKGMIEKGRNVPVAWGHQPVEPYDPFARLAEEIKGICGHAVGAKMEGGVVWALLDVPDEKDAETLKKVRFCSPEVRNKHKAGTDAEGRDVFLPGYRDGAGTVWPGHSITHIAATGKPVAVNQSPFQPVQLSEERMWLSLDDREALQMADDGDKKGEGDGGGGDASLGALIEALREHGLSIPDEVKDMEHLVIAVKANGQGEAPADDTPADVTDDNAAPVVMSMDVATDVKRNPAAAELMKARRKEMKAEAIALGEPALAKELETCQLSFDERWNVVGGEPLTELKVCRRRAKAAPFRKPEQLAQDDLYEGPPAATDDEAEARALAKATAEKLNAGRK